MKKTLLLISATLLTTPSFSQAEDFFVQGGLHFGGDTLATVTFTDGSSQSIEAGGMISFSGGLITEIAEGIDLRTSLGYKFDDITASNGGMDFSRIPVTAMVFTKGELFNAGFGATYHLNPSFSATGVLTGDITIDYDDALGFVGELDFPLSNGRAYVALKATFIEYTIGPVKIDGNSVGILIGTTF